MALAISVNFTITDNSGESSTTQVYVPTGFSISQYVEFAQAMGQIIANLSDGILTNISISLPLSLSGATIRAVAGTFADIAKKALFQAGSAIAGLFARLNLPCYDEAHTIIDTDDIDFADGEVASFIALIEDGVTGVVPCDLRGNNLTTVLLGREIFRKFN